MQCPSGLFILAFLPAILPTNAISHLRLEHATKDSYVPEQRRVAVLVAGAVDITPALEGDLRVTPGSIGRPVFETRFSDIFNFFIKIIEIDFGSIENGSAASDLPPKGSKKKRWADLAHVAHFGILVQLSGFTTQNSGNR